MGCEQTRSFLIVFAVIAFLSTSSSLRVLEPQEKAADIAKLIEALKIDRETEKTEALRKLEKLGKDAEAATQALIRSAIEDTSPSIREQASKVLLKVNPKLGKPMLILIEHKDAKKVTDAANELAALKTEAEPAAQAVLISMRAFDNTLNQPERPKRDPKVVEACVNAIAAICPNNRDVLGELGQTAVLNKEANVRLAAVKCITAMAASHPALRDDTKKYLLSMLADSDARVRQQVFEALSKQELEPREIRAVIAAARKNPNSELKVISDELEAKLKAGKGKGPE